MLKQVASHWTGRRRCPHRPRRRPVVARSSSYPLAGSVPGLPASVSLDICTLLLTLQSATRLPQSRDRVSSIGALDRPRPPPASSHIRTDLTLGKSGRFASEQVDSLLWNEWTIWSEYADWNENGVLLVELMVSTGPDSDSKVLLVRSHRDSETTVYSISRLSRGSLKTNSAGRTRLSSEVMMFPRVQFR